MAMPRALGRELRRLLSSLNTASLFLVILILCAFLAGWLPQFPHEGVRTPAEVQWWWNILRERFAPVVFYPLKALGFFEFFRSPLFFALICFILSSALICTLNRLPGILRVSPPTGRFVTEAGFYTTGPLTASLPANKASALVQRLKRRGYRVLSRKDESLFCFYAEKNRLARLGSIVAHLSLILIVGGLAISLMGRISFTTPPLVSGEAFSVGGQELTLIEFRPERSPEGVPVSYQGLVRTGSGRELVIDIGHPVLVNGALVLFNSYGPAWKLEAVSPEGAPVTLSLEGKKSKGHVIVPFPVQGEVHRVELVEAELTLELSVQPAGLFLEVYKGREQLFQGLVEAEREYKLGGVKVRFSPAYYVEYRIVKDPGFPLAVIGFIAFALGTLAVSFLPYRRVWGLADGETCRVRGGRGISEREWRKLLLEL